MDLFVFEWRQAAVDRRSEGVKRRRQHATSIRRIRVTEASVRNVLETGVA